MAASELLEGPRVHTIFALRGHPATIGSKALGLLIKVFVPIFLFKYF